MLTSSRPIRRTLALTAGAVLLVAAAAGHPFQARADNAPTLGTQAAPAAGPVASPQPQALPLQTQAPLQTQPASEASPTPHRRRRRDAESPAEASPAPSPSSPVYTTFSGTWEVQLQPGPRTAYSHFFFTPTAGTALSGVWRRGTVATPIAGELVGDRFQLSGTDAHGAFAMTGYEESSTSMVGQFTQGTERVAFTASHQGDPAQQRGRGRRAKRR